MQSKIASFVESLLNVGSGFVISLLVWIWIIIPLFGIDTTFTQNLEITAIFTAISVVRGYLWRRIFNYAVSKKSLSGKA